MRRTRTRPTTRTGEPSNTASDTAQPDTAPEVDDEEIVEGGPQTLSDVEKPRRGYIDRMLRPGRMVESAWGGRPIFKCPVCRAQTFSSTDASKHRC